MTLQDQVAVDLDDVFSAAGRNGLVADFRQPESVVLVPDMAYRYGRNRFEVADYVACGDAEPSSAMMISEGMTVCCITLSRHR